MIKEVIISKDSVACVISEYNSRYSIRSFNLENGKWMNTGESGRNSMEQSRQHFIQNAAHFLDVLRRIYATASIPIDTVSFVNYFKKKGQDPKAFILDKLKVQISYLW